MKSLRLFILLASLLPAVAYSEPVYEVRDEGILITLYTEACTLPAVINLPARAEWVENGVTTEGCWTVSSSIPVVVVYFADKTVVAIPAQGFTKVTNI